MKLLKTVKTNYGTDDLKAIEKVLDMGLRIKSDSNLVSLSFDGSVFLIRTDDDLIFTEGSIEAAMKQFDKQDDERTF